MFNHIKKVFVCSPYSGDIAGNTKVAQECCRMVYKRGHIPYAPHLFFPQFLSEDSEKERNDGISGGLVMMALMDEVWVFGEPTKGMATEIEHATVLGLPIKRFARQNSEQKD